jgi:hypothetical protein
LVKKGGFSTSESGNYSSVHQSAITFAFTNFRSLRTYCSSTWLCVVTATITLIGTLSNLGFFANTITIVVGLI